MSIVLSSCIWWCLFENLFIHVLLEEVLLLFASQKTFVFFVKGDGERNEGSVCCKIFVHLQLAIQVENSLPKLRCLIFTVEVDLSQL